MNNILAFVLGFILLCFAYGIMVMSGVPVWPNMIIIAFLIGFGESLVIDAMREGY